MLLKIQLESLDREQATLYWTLGPGHASQVRVIVTEMIATEKRAREISCHSHFETLTFKKKIMYPLYFL